MSVSISLEPDRGDAAGCVRLALGGELDLAARPEVRRAFAMALLRADDVVVDLTGLDFLDICGISLLLDMKRAGERLRYRFSVTGAGGCVERALQLTGAAAALAPSEPTPA